MRHLNDTQFDTLLQELAELPTEDNWGTLGEQLTEWELASLLMHTLSFLEN